ncbi:RNA polymerase sigma factor [Chitinophaga arvensicola]|uniref:RNA polymerase sigma-70 factor, ECF subfamily n=1 Tax=Chitinophaga arvensicola TaxID=29529 RepID=A0A1I0SAK1_9BACT|nr:RNA polymerase sigma-70 factor [Chitinophaga arvensicola]SEW53453.1 RNA polymerase sigma-70 factor, ECF subfamily [Chitinophaga arvensicola]
MECYLNSSDRDLLNGISAGDPEAYRCLFDRYWERIYSAALALSKSPEISEDITQDVFTMIWEKRTTLSTVANLEGFLFISARNLIYSRLRKINAQDNYLKYLRNYFLESHREEEAHIYSRDILQQVQKAMSQLSPQQQRAFRLSRLEGLSHEEIAIEMGISKVTVKSYIVQALAALRKWLPAHIFNFLLPLLLAFPLC